MEQRQDTAAPTHDFKQCKLCGQPTGTPAFVLGAAHLYRCRACDFHYLDRLDPPPDDAPISLTEQQQLYIETRLSANARILAARLNMTREFCTLAGRRCLDIGTGVGQFVSMLHAEGAFCIGIEPSTLRREFARQRFGLELVRALPEDTFWHDQHGTFDLVTLWDVLEHVNDPVTTLRAAYALLIPGGVLLIETDNRDSVSYRLSSWLYRLTRGGLSLFLPHFYRLVPYGHKQIFRPEQLYRLTERCGFELISAVPAAASAGVKKPDYRPPGQIVLSARKPFQAES